MQNFVVKYEKIFGVEVVNIEFELGDLKFEWNSEKAELNFKKHKVKFKTAARVFLDENNLDDYDELHSDDENRFKIIGKVDKVLVVIYTERRERIRIISARYATKKEECEYYEQFY